MESLGNILPQVLPNGWLPRTVLPLQVFMFASRSCYREEHSMDQCRSRLKLSENFERHWSIQISGEIHMDQSLVHTFSWGNSYGPMVLKVLLKFPPTLVLVHRWLFPVLGRESTELLQTSRWAWRRHPLSRPLPSVLF